MSEYLSERDLSEETGLAVKTLQKWRWIGVGPPWLKLGGAVRYRRSDIETWLASRTVTPGRVAAATRSRYSE